MYFPLGCFVKTNSDDNRGILGRVFFQKPHTPRILGPILIIKAWKLTRRKGLPSFSPYCLIWTHLMSKRYQESGTRNQVVWVVWKTTTTWHKLIARNMLNRARRDPKLCSVDHMLKSHNLQLFTFIIHPCTFTHQHTQIAACTQPGLQPNLLRRWLAADGMALWVDATP